MLVVDLLVLVLNRVLAVTEIEKLFYLNTKLENIVFSYTEVVLTVSVFENIVIAVNELENIKSILIWLSDRVFSYLRKQVWDPSLLVSLPEEEVDVL